MIFLFKGDATIQFIFVMYQVSLIKENKNKKCNENIDFSDIWKHFFSNKQSIWNEIQLGIYFFVWIKRYKTIIYQIYMQFKFFECTVTCFSGVSKLYSNGV